MVPMFALARGVALHDPCSFRVEKGASHLVPCRGGGKCPSAVRRTERANRRGRGEYRAPGIVGAFGREGLVVILFGGVQVQAEAEPVRRRNPRFRSRALYGSWRV